MNPLIGNDWSAFEGRSPEHPPSVSVIVAHFDQQAELDRTLAALARQTHPAELTQLIVVDDGSPTAPHLPPGVLLLRQADLGFRLAAARNLGAASATGDVLVFLDADTAPEPTYLEALTRLPALAPDVLAVGRRRHADLAGLPPDAPVEVAGPLHELPSPAWLTRAYAESGDLLRSDDRSYRYIIGAVMACSRTLFDATGGFDETFTTYGGEDWEWAHRAWSAGAAFAHVPAAVAWHDGPDWAARPAPPAAVAAGPDASPNSPTATATAHALALALAAARDRDATPLSDDGRRARKNAETLALAERIAVAGSRPRALRFDAPPPAPGAPGQGSPGAPGAPGTAAGAAGRARAVDIVVRIGAAGSLAALIVCVDTVLQALPSAVVEVPAEFVGTLAQDARILAPAESVSARLVVEVPHAARFAPDELAAAAARVAAEQLGSLELVAAPAPAAAAAAAAVAAPATASAAAVTAWTASDAAGTQQAQAASATSARAGGEPQTAAAASGAERIALISTQRSLAREARWERGDLFAHLTAPSAATRIAVEPDLAAYFGGWG